MSVFLYHTFLACYAAGVRMAAPFYPKARKWLQGRHSWQEKLSAALGASLKKRIWIHCASLGEFEQGRPLIEAFKKSHPEHEIVLTFFSPSGYEVRKNYEYADHIFYLPLDSKAAAETFVSKVRPALAVFVKYEFWYYYMDTLERRAIPVILISAVFRPDQIFFKWYGGLFRQLLKKFSRIFVQDERSEGLLLRNGLQGMVTVAGDTRYDRVVEIADRAKNFPVLDRFKGTDRLIIAGSTWPEDEALLLASFAALPPGWKLVIAPHEIDSVRIRRLQQSCGDTAVLYSELAEKEQPAFRPGPAGDADGNVQGKRVLIINNIGLLSGLYRYGSIAWVGGGFGKGGIHNILEPAVFGLPVLFGPNYKKFVEARYMVEKGYAFPAGDQEASIRMLIFLSRDIPRLEELHADIRRYIRQHTGARDIIMKEITARSWLG